MLRSETSEQRVFRADVREWIAGNLNPALRFLTFRPLPVTAADTLAWFHTLPSEHQGKLRAGLTTEREAELLAKLRASAMK